MQRGHKAVNGIKRHLIQPMPVLAQLIDIQAGPCCQRHQSTLHGVAFDRPDLAFGMSDMGVVAKRRTCGEVQQLRMQRRLGLLALQAETPLGRIALAIYVEAGPGQHHGTHAHFIARQSAGLVGADDGDRAQCLHRRQIAHDGIACGHALHANGQRNRHDHGQAFGDGRYGNTHHGDEGVGRVVAAPP